jgi:hypothetical protein
MKCDMTLCYLIIYCHFFPVNFNHSTGPEPAPARTSAPTLSVLYLFKLQRFNAQLLKSMRTVSTVVLKHCSRNNEIKISAANAARRSRALNMYSI